MANIQKDYSGATKRAIDFIKRELEEIKGEFGQRIDYAQKAVEVAQRDYKLEITRSNVYSTLNGYYKKPNVNVIKSIKTALKEIKQEYAELETIPES